jgi:hypothetical protein
MKIEREVIITILDDNGEKMNDGDMVLYTTKSSPYATVAYYKGLNDRGNIVLADYATKEEYAKAPANFVTFQKAAL